MSTGARGINRIGNSHRIRIYHKQTVYTRSIRDNPEWTLEENLAHTIKCRNLMRNRLFGGGVSSIEPKGPVDYAAYKEIFKQARKRRPNEYHLTKEDERRLINDSQDACALTGITFVKKQDHWSRNAYGPSLDRIDSSKGYSMDNVRLVCVAVNLAMNEWGEDVLRNIANGYLANNPQYLVKIC